MMAESRKGPKTNEHIERISADQPHTGTRQTEVRDPLVSCAVFEYLLIAGLPDAAEDGSCFLAVFLYFSSFPKLNYSEFAVRQSDIAAYFFIPDAAAVFQRSNENK